MVNVNEPRAQSAVSMLKSQPTDDASQTVVGDARLAGCSVSLVSVHQELSHRAFAIRP